MYFKFLLKKTKTLIFLVGKKKHLVKLRLDTDDCVSHLRFCLSHIFFFLPTPLALFMGHEQCIKASVQC